MKVRDYKITFTTCSERFACSDDTDVQCYGGWKPITEIGVGDYLVAKDGVSLRIVSIYRSDYYYGKVTDTLTINIQNKKNAKLSRRHKGDVQE